jgi:TAT (twin-arginine translocation) pathway signal sequence
VTPSRLAEVEISRRQFLRGAGAGGALLLMPGLAWPRGPALVAPRPMESRTADSVVLRWNSAALQGVRDSKLGPPMVARALAIVHTSVYDAWAPYDNHATGTRLGDALRRPDREHTQANKEIAISFAAYRAAVDLFPGDRVSVFDPLMRSLGLDPNDTTTDVSTPAGIGNVAARAVLEWRHRDGANQLGDEPGGLPGVAYSDYTGYASTNAPMDIRVAFDPTAVHDPNRWQQLRYVDATGAVVTPAFVGAQWQRVKPFALSSAGQLRPSEGPARYGSDRYLSQASALLDLSAGLTDEQKMIAEYWADGPHSELPPGHWDLFAQFVSRRDHDSDGEHSLDADVQLFFAITNAIFDASICCWDNKRTFDSVRPITAIRYLFKGQLVRSWAGPFRGTQLIRGEDWFPYQALTFPTPPFPEYSSGHSTFSAAGAEILRLFTKSDRFGATVTLPAGSSKFEPGLVPARDVTLTWSSFKDAADQAGLSRRYGGIHFEQGDLDGRNAGRLVAQQAWTKATSYFRGEALG